MTESGKGSLAPSAKALALKELLRLPGGREALKSHQPEDDDLATTSTDEDMQLRSRNAKAKHDGFIDISTIGISSSEEEEEEDELASATRRPRNGRVPHLPIINSIQVGGPALTCLELKSSSLSLVCLNWDFAEFSLD
ncbi:hypothetical protein IQ06DRAFT_311647 [Phaeosphaeriaceae sp. SRC1lsM3a]|nr:hypothetical protein IQ06DRAFT_311647 [Stagonospora sp. SRC1lsM3a]